MNTIAVVPELGLPSFQIEYQAKIEYIIDTRFGKEPKPFTEAETKPDSESEGDDPPVEKTSDRSPKAKESSSRSWA